MSFAVRLNRYEVELCVVELLKGRKEPSMASDFTKATTKTTMVMMMMMMILKYYQAHVRVRLGSEVRFMFLEQC